MENQFLTDFSVTCWFHGLTPWNFNFVPVLKKKHICARTQLLHYAHSLFWSVLASFGNNVLRFLAHFFTFECKLLKLARDWSALFFAKMWHKGSKSWTIFTPILSTGRLKYELCKKQIEQKILGDTACWSWICCAVQYPHRNSEPVEGHLKMPQINWAKPQWLYIICKAIIYLALNSTKT